MTPVILDTDIGTDIDDTWALAMLLNSPELKLEAVVTSHGDTRYRALLAAKMLAVAGREDVPVGEGAGHGELAANRRGQEAWLEGYEPDAYGGVYRTDGAQLMVDTINSSEETVTVLCIGPASTTAQALAMAPANRRESPFRRHAWCGPLRLSRQHDAGTRIQRVHRRSGLSHRTRRTVAGHR